MAADHPFRHRDFACFFASRLSAGVGTQILNIGVGWLVYDLTRDPFALGLVGLVTFLPAVLLALVTGHVADRFDRRLVMLAGYTVAALAVLGLLWFVAAAADRVWIVFVLVVLFGTGRAFANPASQAIVPSLVPPALLRQVIAWNSSAFQSAIIAGPAIGGLLWLLGGTAVFGAALACFLTTLALITLVGPRPPTSAREPASWARVIAGFTFIRSRPVILGAISLDLVAVLLGGATALLPIYARDILFIGPWGLGLLRAAPAVGAVSMAIFLAWRPLERHAGMRMLQAIGVFGLALTGFGLSTNLWLSLVLLAISGAADMISVVVRQTLVQLETPDEMRGRVAAVNTVFIGASNELGEFESGVAAGLIGTVPAVVLGGVCTLGVAAIWGRLFPDLRDRDRLAPS